MKFLIKNVLLVFVSILFFSSCKNNGSEKMQIKLMTLDPGHFHAALVQKNQYDQVSSDVFIYAPVGEDVEDHMNRIINYNSRSENPTNWNLDVYKGADYFEKMIKDKPGNVVVISGNNMKKADYILGSINSGLNVLADKPMCINKEGFDLLLKAFELAKQKNVLLYDIMTERSEITTILQKELIEIPELFGDLAKGSLEDPVVVKSSVHHFFKYVSGNPLKRPAWFFDSSQQGDGIVDVTTHLVDLVQWELFPEQILDYKNDIKIVESKHWPTILTKQEFSAVTKMDKYPEFLNKFVNEGNLNVYSNGEINYQLKGVNAKVIVEWKYQAPEGGGDTHYSIIRGTKSNIIIKQGKEQNYKPELYIEKINEISEDDFEQIVSSAIKNLQNKYPGISVEKEKDIWHIFIPDNYRVGHEAHFAQVMERYLEYLENGKLPEWEVPNIIAKYYTTIQALEKAM
ncbi:MAG: oxidoreductase [Ignavibacteriales bacterium]|nr:oxidoreductase [Ignavibacteriales bacterium]